MSEVTIEPAWITAGIAVVSSLLAVGGTLGITKFRAVKSEEKASDAESKGERALAGLAEHQLHCGVAAVVESKCIAASVDAKAAAAAADAKATQVAADLAAHKLHVSDVYAKKLEVTVEVNRVESRLVRIEDKLDRVLGSAHIVAVQRTTEDA